MDNITDHRVNERKISKMFQCFVELVEIYKDRNSAE